MSVRMIFGRGVWIGREGAEALRDPMELLPEGDRLYWPICRKNEADEWRLPSVGDAVFPQQRMAERLDGKMPCYPSTTGRIEALTEMHLKGEAWICAQIHPENVFTDEPKHRLNRPSKNQITPEAIIHLAEETGIVDELDGCLLADKLREWQRQEIHLLVCDAVCDDPFNTDALCALREYPVEAMHGLDLASQACANAETLVVTFRKESLGLHEMRRLRTALGFHKQLNVGGFYPIWPKLKKEPPFNAGFGRIGVQACIHLSQAMNLQRPPERCIITVGGEGIVSCRNFSVLLGTPVSEVLRYCKRTTDSADEIRVGHTLTGYPLQNPDTPVMQDTRCILVGIPDTEFRMTACIGCGKCNEACTEHIFVSDAVAHIQRREDEQALADGLRRCIGCNACSFVCPSGIPIAKQFSDLLERMETLRKEEAAE